MRVIKYFCLIMLCVGVQACKKSPIEGSLLTASINVVNAIATDDANIKVNFTGKPVKYSDAIPLSYYNSDGKGNTNGANSYGLPADIKVPLIVVMETDTLKPIYNETKQFNGGDFYTLYLAGRPGSIDPILVKENIPLRTDSTTGVRFVNLCQDCGVVNVNIENSPAGSFISNLPFKTVSEFKSLPATAKVNAYEFQVTDPITGEQISSYWYSNLARMRNVTLILRGLGNGSVYLEVVRINN